MDKLIEHYAPPPREGGLLDWVVLSAGILALGFAIAATTVVHTTAASQPGDAAIAQAEAGNA